MKIRESRRDRCAMPLYQRAKELDGKYSRHKRIRGNRAVKNITVVGDVSPMRCVNNENVAMPRQGHNISWQETAAHTLPITANVLDRKDKKTIAVLLFFARPHLSWGVPARCDPRSFFTDPESGCLKLAIFSALVDDDCFPFTFSC